MRLSNLIPYAAAALFGALATYAFATSIEARRAAFQRHLEAEGAALAALRSWRASLIRAILSRQVGAGGVFPRQDVHDEEDLAARILLASQGMPQWKSRLVRKALVALLGETAVLTHWLGPTHPQQDTSGESWFSAFLDLGDHFEEHVITAFMQRSGRFTQPDDAVSAEVISEANFLERALLCRWWHRPLLAVALVEGEVEALKRFGFLPDRSRAWQRIKLAAR